YHSDSDLCVVCGSPVPALFLDRFEGGQTLAYAPFVADVPVHARKECLERVGEKLGRRAPQQLDRLRREFTLERGRPSARMAQFFRADALSHPPFDLEEWANSLAEANRDKLDRAAM